MSEKTILVIEDDMVLAETLQEFLESIGFKVVRAHDFDEANERYHENQNALAILMDGHIPGALPNTSLLVRLIRYAGFQGMLIAMSSHKEVQDALMAAGCTHKVNKGDLVTDLRALFCCQDLESDLETA